VYQAGFSKDDARREGAVIALADDRLHHLVLRGDGLQLGQRRLFRQRLDELAQVELVLAADVGGNDRIDQRGARRVAEGGQHCCFFAAGRADVARDEGIAGFELGEAGAGHGGGQKEVTGRAGPAGLKKE